MPHCARHQLGTLSPNVGTLTFNGTPNFSMTEGIASTTGLIEFQDSDGNTNPVVLPEMLARFSA
jgi:hypothetical protein